jgi:hypothetical protein
MKYICPMAKTKECTVICVGGHNVPHRKSKCAVKKNAYGCPVCVPVKKREA